MDLNDYLCIIICPAICLSLIVYVAITKKHPSDKFNSKISKNLKEYEKEIDHNDWD